MITIRKTQRYWRTTASNEANYTNKTIMGGRQRHTAMEGLRRERPKIKSARGKQQQGHSRKYRDPENKTQNSSPILLSRNASRSQEIHRRLQGVPTTQGSTATSSRKAPWETICVDFVEPLPRSSHGNKMLLIFIDEFSCHVSRSIKYINFGQRCTIFE